MSDLHADLDFEEHKGVKCAECKSVLFDVQKLLRHCYERPGHRLFTSNDDVSIRLTFMADVDAQTADELQWRRDEMNESVSQQSVYHTEYDDE